MLLVTSTHREFLLCIQPKKWAFKVPYAALIFEVLMIALMWSTKMINYYSW